MIIESVEHVMPSLFLIMWLKPMLQEVIIQITTTTITMLGGVFDIRKF